MRGDGAELPPRPAPREIVAVAIVAVVVIGGLTLLTSILEVALLLGTFAASSLLVFAFPDAPFSQPRNVLLGHLIPAGTGFKPYQGIVVKRLVEEPIDDETSDQEME
ncbi:MAG: hypothetical protein EBR95_05915, partial [Verrucomicrobia bacterium]|nr:hypothetical protein [Verrucomicrobiota bacterium]